MPNISLFEKYRPRTFDDVIGQDKVIKTLKRMERLGQLPGNAYWITGNRGTGKTSTARILASKIADAADIVEVDARDCTLDFVREIVETFRTADRCTLFELRKVWIINEADDLRADVMARFKTALDPVHPNCAVIFTCTKASAQLLWEDDEDAPQFLARCIPLAFTTRGLADAFAQRLHDCADAEGLNGKPIEWYKRMMMDNRNDLRAGFCQIQAGAAIDDE